MLKAFTFLKSARLLTAKQFRQTLSGAISVANKELLLIAQNHQQGCARLGLAIKRKHVKKAVHRNLIKRIIRESFRQHQSQLEGIDVVILSRVGLAKLDRLQLRETIDKQWLRLLKRCRKQST